MVEKKSFLLTIFFFLRFTLQSDGIVLFSSSPLIKVEQSKICGSSNYISNVLLIKSLAHNQVLTWGKQCGFQIMSIDNQSQKATFQKVNIEIPEFMVMSVHTDSSIVWLSDMNQFTAIDFSDLANVKQVVNRSRSQMDQPPIQIEVIQNNKVMFIMTKTKIETYWIEELTNIIPLIIVDAGESINCLSFNQNNGYLIIGTERRMIIYEVIIDYVNKSIQFNPPCLTPYSFTLNLLKFYDSNNIIIISKFLGLWQVNLKDYYQNKDCSQVSLKYIQSANNLIYFQFFEITKNLKYIISEQNFRNVEIYEIDSSNDGAKFILFQEIEILNESLDLKLLDNEQFLVRVYQESIDIYTRVEHNFQERIPNIEAGNQGVIVLEPEMISDLSRRCVLQDNIFHFSKIQDGLFLFKRDPINGYLSKLSIYKPFKEDYESSMPLKSNPNRIIVGASKIQIVDVSDITNPQPKQVTNFGYSSFDADHFTLNKQENLLFIAAGRAGIVIADISDIDNPIALSKIYHPFSKYPSASSENIYLDKQDKFAFVAYRNLGIMIYNVEDPVNPKYISSVITMNCESFALSQDDTFLVIADLQKGITIVDIKDRSNPLILGSVFVEGKSYDLTLIQNDQFALVASNLRGQIQLVDIRNKQNPKVLQKYSRKGFTNANFICMSPDQETAYLILNAAILIIQLYPPKISFNIDVSLVQNGSQILQNRVILDHKKVLMVGQRVHIKLVRMYPLKSINFMGVKYYSDFQQYELPPWAVFSQIDQILKVEITKDSIDRDDTSTSTRSFIFEGKEVLYKQDFERADISIDSAASLSIFEQCRHNNIVDTADFVIISSEDFIKRVFSAYNIQQINHILYVLKNKIFYKPIYLNTQKSLEFVRSSSSVPPKIKTISDTIIISLKVDPSLGKLLQVQYASVLTYYTEQQDEMRIEGQVDLINKIISQGGFRFSNSTDPKNIHLTLTIDDTINYPLVIQVEATDNQLIKLNSPVKINKQRPIQVDFEEQFQDSSIFILEVFSYTFNTNVFIDEDENDKLTFSAQILIDGEFQSFPESYWVSFQANEHSFYGSTKANQYQKEVQFKIIASDGYTFAEDYLVIQIDKIPLWYVFQLMAQILGPIIGILGLWKYKSSLINRVNNHKFQSMTQLFYADSDFVLQIPLLEDQRKLAHQIWNEYYKKVDKHLIIKEITQIKEIFKQQEKEKIILNQLNKKPKSDDQLKQENQFNNNNLKTEYQFITVDGNDQQMSSCNTPLQNELKEKHTHNMNTLTEQKQSTFQQNYGLQFQTPQTIPLSKVTEQSDSKNNLFCYSFLENDLTHTNKISNSQVEQNELLFRSYLLKDEIQTEFKPKSLTQRDVQRWKRALSNRNKNETVQQQQNHMNMEFFLNNGNLNVEQILKNVSKYCASSKQFNVKVISDLQNEQSKLSFCIICFCAQSISELDSVTMSIIKFLKELSIKNNYTSQEWYKAYLEVIPNPDKIYKNPFPQILFLSQSLQKAITQLQSILPLNGQIPTFEVQAIQHLMKWTLVAHTFGITSLKEQLLNKVRGESLEIYPHQILCVKSFKPTREKSIFRCFREKEVLIEKEFSENTTIPSWMKKIDISNGAILMQGKIEHKDIGIHILKIYSTQKFIIKEFKIVIQEKMENKQISKETPFFDDSSFAELEQQELQQGGISVKLQKYSLKNTQKNDVSFQ